MPRKTFVNGEVLTDTDINTYLTNETTLTASTATAYTVVTADRNTILTFSNAGTVTVSTATAFLPGERVDLVADGASLQIAAGAGVTLAGVGSTAAAFNITEQYNGATVLCVDTNTYRVIGKIEAV